MEKLLAFLLPALIDVINRKIADTDIRFWVSVFICGLAGTGLDFVSGGFTDFNSWAEMVLATFGLAQLSYKAIWENSNIRESLGLNAKKNDI